MAHFFLMLNNIPFLNLPQFIYSFTTEEHLGCFQVFEIMNKAAISINMQDFV
jgi:hypothetical protein